MSLQERTLEVSLSENNIRDQVGQLLYATGCVNNDEEIIEMKFSEPREGTIWTTIKIRKGG